MSNQNESESFIRRFSHSVMVFWRDLLNRRVSSLTQAKEVETTDNAASESKLPSGMLPSLGSTAASTHVVTWRKNQTGKTALGKQNRQTQHQTLPEGTVSGFREFVLLNDGGMGNIYRAYDENIEGYVAIKIPKTEKRRQQIEQHFAQEIKMTGRLRNEPHIATVYQSTQTINGKPCLIMELINGISLREYIALESDARNKFSSSKLSERLGLFYKICQVVSEEIHSNGIIHRDLKLENIMLSFPVDEGSNTLNHLSESIKILDFGIALEKSTTGNGYGTPCYMSPEQLNGEDLVAPKNDIYALGIILAEIIFLERRKVLNRKNVEPLEDFITRIRKNTNRLNYAVNMFFYIKVGRMISKATMQKFSEVSEILLEINSMKKYNNIALRGGGLVILIIVLVWVGNFVFQTKNLSQRIQSLFPLQANEHLWNPIEANLDEDPELEFATSVYLKKDSSLSKKTKIVSLESNGDLRWERPLGKKLQFDDGSITANSSPGNLIVVKTVKNRVALLTRWYHDFKWPSWLTILDADTGQILSEYLNGGHLHPVLVEDINGDGKQEVIAGGIHNHLQETVENCSTAILLVLGTTDFHGRSPGIPEPEGLNLPLGQERVYLTFPMSDLAQHLCLQEGRYHHSPRNIYLRETEPGGDSMLMVEIATNGNPVSDKNNTPIYYYFDAKTLLPVSVEESSSFSQMRSEKVRQGILQPLKLEDYERGLLEGIRYFDNNEWLSPSEWANRRGLNWD